MHAAHRAGAFIAICALGAAMLGPTGAEEIAVGNYGIAANGMPFAVALEKKLYSRKAPTSPASSPRRAAAPRSATCWPAASPTARPIRA